MADPVDGGGDDHTPGHRDEQPGQRVHRQVHPGQRQQVR